MNKNETDGLSPEARVAGVRLGIQQLLNKLGFTEYALVMNTPNGPSISVQGMKPADVALAGQILSFSAIEMFRNVKPAPQHKQGGTIHG